MGQIRADVNSDEKQGGFARRHTNRDECETRNGDK